MKPTLAVYLGRQSERGHGRERIIEVFTVADILHRSEELEVGFDCHRILASMRSAFLERD